MPAFITEILFFGKSYRMIVPGLRSVSCQPSCLNSFKKLQYFFEWRMTYLNDVSLGRLNEVKLVKRIQKKKIGEILCVGGSGIYWSISQCIWQLGFHLKSLWRDEFLWYYFRFTLENILIVLVVKCHPVLLKVELFIWMFGYKWVTAFERMQKLTTTSFSFSLRVTKDDLLHQTSECTRLKRENIELESLIEKTLQDHM